MRLIGQSDWNKCSHWQGLKLPHKQQLVIAVGFGQVVLNQWSLFLVVVFNAERVILSRVQR